MRDKGLATAGAVALVAFAVAHLMQFGLSAGRALSDDSRAAPVGLATWIAAGSALPPTPPVPADPPPPPPVLIAADLRVPPDAPMRRPPELPNPFDPACDRRLAVTAAPGGLLRLRLDAPCDPGVRVEIAHAGLRFAMTTGPSGEREAVLPALAADAVVTAAFDDGARLSARTVAGVVGEPIAVVAEGGSGVALRTGAAEVHRLGDPGAPAPLLAEVHRRAAGSPADAWLEAEVTARSCGRDLEVLLLRAGPGGAPERTALTLAMPDCTATGDVVVLPLGPPALRVAGN